MSNGEIILINEMVSENVMINAIDDEVVNVTPITEEPIAVEVLESEPATVIDNLTEVPVHVTIQGISIKQKGVPNGVATLDENGKVPLEQIPDLIIDPEGIKNEVRQWIDDLTSDKITAEDTVVLIQNAIQNKVDQNDLIDVVRTQDLHPYVLKEDLNTFVTEQDVSNSIDSSLQPINQNIQSISTQLLGIDALLSEILGE